MYDGVSRQLAVSNEVTVRREDILIQGDWLRKKHETSKWLLGTKGRNRSPFLYFLRGKNQEICPLKV